MLSTASIQSFLQDWNQYFDYGIIQTCNEVRRLRKNVNQRN